MLLAGVGFGWVIGVLIVVALILLIVHLARRT